MSLLLHSCEALALLTIRTLDLSSSRLLPITPSSADEMNQYGKEYEEGDSGNLKYVYVLLPPFYLIVKGRRGRKSSVGATVNERSILRSSIDISNGDTPKELEQKGP